MQDVALAVQLKIPMIIWGPPGTGKTSAIYQLGKALNLPTEVVIASIHDPSDFSGLPIPITGDDPHVWYAAPDWAVRLAKAGRGLLFFDEISCFPAGTMITMADGSEKPIEELAEGDEVIGYDLNTGQACANLVLSTRRQHANKLIRIKLADGRELRATGDHKIFTKDGWKEAKDIKAGDSLLSFFRGGMGMDRQWYRKVEGPDTCPGRG